MIDDSNLPQNISSEDGIDTSSEQLDLDLKGSRFEFFYNIINHVEKYEVYFRAMPFWKSWINVFSMITILVDAFLLVVFRFAWYDDLSQKIPFFYSQAKQNWFIYDKSIINIIFIGFGSLVIFLYLLTVKIFEFDKRLAIALNIGIIIISVVFFTAIFQIYSLQLW